MEFGARPILNAISQNLWHFGSSNLLLQEKRSEGKGRKSLKETLTTFKRESSSSGRKPRFRKFKSAEDGRGRTWTDSGKLPSKKMEENDSTDSTSESPNSSHAQRTQKAKKNRPNSITPAILRLNAAHLMSAQCPLQEYYYQRFQEEQLAVQLLLNLRYSSSSPQSCENFQTQQAAYDPSCAGYPMYMYPSVPFYGQYNSMY
ncbi:hypothetical protein OS493_039820 [Desmophyllum pertusum]|uniref:Uncharacterized protein n=1 Tax=Desmophyllum pertusum TaxID=174260 RepID=A0A9X0CZW0_9CNID|nr:hypothetical protein OS493_039820 [Desmophyllum pertusum]